MTMFVNTLQMRIVAMQGHACTSTIYTTNLKKSVKVHPTEFATYAHIDITCSNAL